MYQIVKQKKIRKRVMGIEPTYSAWKADVLPLNYTRTLPVFRKCPVPESNQRHEDFQSSALPTELTGHAVSHSKDYSNGNEIQCQAYFGIRLLWQVKYIICRSFPISCNSKSALLIFSSSKFVNGSSNTIIGFSLR